MDGQHPPEVWSWLDSIWGFGAGVVAAVSGLLVWFTPRLNKVKRLAEATATNAHKENDMLAAELHTRINSMEKLMIILQENNREGTRLYASLRDELKDLTLITNQQTKLLYKMIGALNIKGDKDE